MGLSHTPRLARGWRGVRGLRWDEAIQDETGQGADIQAAVSGLEQGRQSFPPCRGPSGSEGYQLRECTGWDGHFYFFKPRSQSWTTCFSVSVGIVYHFTLAVRLPSVYLQEGSEGLCFCPLFSAQRRA